MKPAGRVSLTTETPSYDRGTRRFAQVMSFRSNGPALDGGAVGRLTETACKLFRDVLIMNDLDDFAWPPDEVDVRPNKDFTGGLIVLATRAAKRSAIVLQ